MKVAIIGSRGVPARYGGFETFAEVLARGLADRGHEVIVYSLPEFRKVPFDYPKVERTFVRASKFSSVQKVSMSSLAIFHSAFRGKSGAIIFLGVSGGLLMWLPRVMKTKTLVNIDGLEWRRSRWGGLIKFGLKTLEHLAVKWSDVVIADSEAIGQYVVSEYKRDYSYIPYGADECKYTEKDWDDMKRRYNLEPGGYYLIVGRHVPENNFDISIEGFLKSESSRKLVIVSNLAGQETVLSPKVIFAGGIYDRPKLFALRANAFAYIHGHSVGGTNPSLLEAISSNNIVLAYDVQYNREVLSEYGYYYRDEKDLGRSIIFLEKDYKEPDREKMLKYYRSILEEKYNWDIVINQYEKLLH